MPLAGDLMIRGAGAVPPKAFAGDLKTRTRAVPRSPQTMLMWSITRRASPLKRSRLRAPGVCSAS